MSHPYSTWFQAGSPMGMVTVVCLCNTMGLEIVVVGMVATTGPYIAAAYTVTVELEIDVE